MINLLIYDAPTAIEVNGIQREIYTDFRDFIEIDIHVNNGDNDLAALLVLDLFKEPLSESEALAAVDAVFGFIKEADEEEQRTGGRNAAPVFSFDTDMPYILAAFRQYYQIDLIRIPYLHWYEFKALLTGLPEDSELKKRVGYRSINLGQIKDKEEKKRIARIKNAIRIKTKKKHYLTDEEIGAAF